MAEGSQIGGRVPGAEGPGTRPSNERVAPVGPTLGDRIAAAEAALALRDYHQAGELLADIDVEQPAPLDELIDSAELLAKAQQPEKSDALFEALVAKFRGNRRLHFLYGKRLYVRGWLVKSVEIFGSAKPFVEGTNPHRFISRARTLLAILEAREGRTIGAEEDCRLLALKHAILAYARRTPRPIERGGIGKISLVTGGLGPGGAERQLSRTAAQLERIRMQDGHIGGVGLRGKIEVLVRTHSGDGQRDFYLPDLESAGVEVLEIDKLPAVTPNEFGVSNGDLAMLLDYLPHKADFGARRLVQHFHNTQPDVVSLWQDGACLFAGLAALIAGVPKVQLVIRGLPPVIRKHMFHPHYEEMYRALAKVPGVEFVSNSKAAAEAYADWLDIPASRFAILYNGVQQMTDASSDGLEAQWATFCERTADATHTIGGVFRFDVDKRPATWIRYAARHSSKYPNSRFVLVGDGKLFEEAVKLAHAHGISDRILFVGHSSNVGFWLSKMDVLVLMSSFEGLPNVLIEAQFSGVPVVSTPAGGAAECFVEGISGHILSCAVNTDLDEACDKVHALVGRARDPEIFGPLTADFLEPSFSVLGMIENFAKWLPVRRAHGRIRLGQGRVVYFVVRHWFERS